MCLLVCAWRSRPEAPLLVLANRDELYARAAAPLAPWGAGIVAGRDLQAGGTWLGVAPGGRFAALTNVREPGRAAPLGAPSRGELVPAFLSSQRSASEWVLGLEGQRYAGFNLLACDGAELWWISNRGPAPRALGPGTYGLSNALLDTPWPKVLRLREALSAREPSGDPEGLLELLRDESPPPVDALPDTGVGPELERLLGTVFIRSQAYGTRCSTLVLSGLRGARVVEQSYLPGGGLGARVTGEVGPSEEST